ASEYVKPISVYYRECVRCSYWGGSCEPIRDRKFSISCDVPDSYWFNILTTRASSILEISFNICITAYFALRTSIFVAYFFFVLSIVDRDTMVHVGIVMQHSCFYPYIFKLFLCVTTNL